MARRKFRTILTIIAILLGVSILMGTSIASDSIRYSLNYQVTKQFGYTDALIINEAVPNSNSIPLDLIMNELRNMTEIQFEWTLQMRQYRTVTPYANISAISANWFQFIGINATNPVESHFGSIFINSTINETLSSLEEMLTYPLITNSCVITHSIAKSYNLTVGQSLYVYPESPWAGIDWTNSSTWINLTITGIIEDRGKSFEWLSPPITDLWEIYPAQNAIYVHIDIAKKYIFNQDPSKINLILIHASNIQIIDSTIEIILNILKNSSNPEISSIEFYGFNIKSFFDEQIGGMFNFFSIILALFSGVSLLICAILIKNLFEITKEEQIEEIGIMRAIGISKHGIFRIYLSQISIISIIGTICGIGFGCLISQLFLGPIKIISFSINPSLLPIIGSDLEIIFVITSFSLFFSLLVGVTVSMIFGMIPAISASNVNVLKALNPRLMEEQ